LARTQLAVFHQIRTADGGDAGLLVGLRQKTADLSGGILQ